MSSTTRRIMDHATRLFGCGLAPDVAFAQAMQATYASPNAKLAAANMWPKWWPQVAVQWLRSYDGPKN